MSELHNIYLKIIQGKELTIAEKSILENETENDPGLQALLDQMREMSEDTGQIPSEYLDNDQSWDRLLVGMESYNSVDGNTKKSGKEKKQSVLKISWIVRYAAVFIGLVLTGYAVYIVGFKEHPEPFMKESGDEIVLQLADGSTRILDITGNDTISGSNGSQVISKSKDQLIYSPGDGLSTNKETAYNRLTVPHGKRFGITLSDGTRIHVNSGSTIRYPVVFGKGGTREVELENGEAYFSVTRNENSPFTVHTNEMNVKVLGTEFNVSAYDEDNTVRAVLVEGAVELEMVNNQSETDRQDLTLKPGDLVTYHKTGDEWDKKQVDVLSYIAWKDNRLVFVDEPFDEIIKKVERSYGVTIINKSKTLENARFYGDFQLEDENIEDVLEVFATGKPFDYSIENGLITIKDTSEK
ncbi:FecR family protein [Membranihabitans maritimus]|uniref:FecR family protein n=1 Tax=Membranihabitans maritimus TaxID=2904244 RepID=UPI001F3051C4|nr:FecR domain-containing protein [Membranihabitans maritimus]